MLKEIHFAYLIISEMLQLKKWAAVWKRSPIVDSQAGDLSCHDTANTMFASILSVVAIFCACL